MLIRNDSFLAQIFHTDRYEGAAKADGAPPAVGRPRGRLPLGSPERARRAGASESTQTHILTQGCVYTHCPRKTSRSTQHPYGFPASVGDRDEICGLAFSLLEVLVALSLLAMTLVGILDLWPASQRLIFEAEQKRSASLIAQRIIETLKATSPSGVIAVSSDWIDNPSHCIRVELSSPSEHVVAYDACGIPQCERSIAESLNSLRDKNIASVARITIAKALPPGLARVLITVASPAALPDEQRHHTEFTCFLLILPPKKNSSEEGSY